MITFFSPNCWQISDALVWKVSSSTILTFGRICSPSSSCPSPLVDCNVFASCNMYRHHATANSDFNHHQGCQDGLPPPLGHPLVMNKLMDLMAKMGCTPLSCHLILQPIWVDHCPPLQAQTDLRRKGVMGMV